MFLNSANSVTRPHTRIPHSQRITSVRLNLLCRSCRVYERHRREELTEVYSNVNTLPTAVHAIISSCSPSLLAGDVDLPLLTRDADSSLLASVIESSVLSSPPSLAFHTPTQIDTAFPSLFYLLNHTQTSQTSAFTLTHHKPLFHHSLTTHPPTITYTITLIPYIGNHALKLGIFQLFLFYTPTR